jgi:hypothetical protein
MKKNNINISEKTQDRFGMYFSIYRIAGIGILNYTYPKIYRLYAICAFVSSYATVAAMILDILQHTHDLQYCMSSIQAVAAVITSLWVHQFLR